ncbi:acyltransferase family protein [Sinorhizobium meliloti]|uniref:acyltransferase family protein n=1 Tax=Rhizobium meliloti TaxID=382 RepID=UPI002090B292|nr:acyltransferase [Sinorhizobium meliloti]MCO5964844.1 acyltransferase [Sinorhizobium meliloti]
MVFNVQVLRGVAALLVVWVHTQELITGQNILPGWARHFGYGGVDMFFVISGFIMVHTTHDKDIRPFSFIKKRIFRIVPLYYFFTFLTIFIYILVPQILNSTRLEFLHVVKSMLFIPFEKTHGRVYPLYYLGWTLNFEMMFYTFFSFSMFFPKSIRSLVLAAVLIALAGIGRNVENLTEHGVVAYFYTRPILLDFAFGVFIAWFFQSSARISNPAPWWCLLAAGTAWFILGGDVFPVATLPIAPMTDTVLRFGVPSALIVAGAIGLELAGFRIGNSLMRRAGDASYSIYLSHFFLVAGVIVIADRLGLGERDRALLLPLTMAATIALGFITYHLLERPLAGDFGSYHSISRRFIGPAP